VTTPSDEAPLPAREPSPTTGRAGRAVLVVAALVAVLAVVETVTATVAPALAPKDADWAAAAAEVRAGFRPGDLIVAAPDWADPIMRLHLGDLVPVPVAGRMDDARFGRVCAGSARSPSAASSARPRR
jgi:hypothetical protein